MATLTQESTEKKPAVPNAKEAAATLTKMQRLAALLVVLGPDIAANILNQFDEQQVEEITLEMSKITFVPLPLQKMLLREFSEVTMDAVTSAQGGPQVAKEVLEKSLGSYKAHEMLSRIAPNRAISADKSILREIEPRQLLTLLRQEQPQTWALVLSNLESNRCAEVLSLLPVEIRINIVERIATMEPVSADMIQQVLTLIKNRLTLPTEVDFTTRGGHKNLAEIINTLDEDTSAQVLASLEEKNPTLCRAIKKLLFVFEDLAEFDKTAITRILRELDFHILAVALKRSSEKLKGVVAGGLSKRAADSLKEEMDFMPAIPDQEINDAQDKIIETVRTLQASGEIVTPKKGKKSNGSA